MKNVLLSLPVCAAVWSGAALAAPVDAVSFLNVSHGFVVDGGIPGASPIGIRSTVSGPTISTERLSGIDDPAAVLAVDSSAAQVGSASFPVVPYTYTAQHRTNRTDPTEFADANGALSVRSEQDNGLDVISFAIGTRDVERDGLAQVRITSDPVAASATSSDAFSRVGRFENVTFAPIDFNISGYYDASLLSRYSGADGFARTSSTWEVLFSGHTDGNLTYIPLDTYITGRSEIGTGALVTDELLSQPSGVEGIILSATTSAFGTGGFTEASLTAEHDFLFRLTVDPGQIVEMAYGFSQSNVVDYTPPTPLPPVPLPAASWLLIASLGGLLSLGRPRT